MSIKKMKTRKKNPAAVALGRLGGLKKGPTKARSPEVCRRAAKARWEKRAALKGEK